MYSCKTGKKKVTTGSKAAEQQDCNSGLPQQVSVPVPCSDGKPSAKVSKDSDPQRAGKGTREVKSADFKSSPSKLLSDRNLRVMVMMS
ncbi:unnamed protein product [Sphagnum jensenii]|uniref:Uncharacterized protein n=1 Tax=Sphagnum jensenii TaxID=128206 RepID=A0ABP0X8W9_9BRYO